jgi:hypothetical protein
MVFYLPKESPHIYYMDGKYLEPVLFAMKAIFSRFSPEVSHYQLPAQACTLMNDVSLAPIAQSVQFT